VLVLCRLCYRRNGRDWLLGIFCAVTVTVPLVDVASCGVAALSGVVVGEGANRICDSGCDKPAPKATMFIDDVQCQDTSCTVYYTLFDDEGRCGVLDLTGYWSGPTPTSHNNWESNRTDYHNVCAGNTVPAYFTLQGGDHAQCDIAVTLFIGFTYDYDQYTYASRYDQPNVMFAALPAC